MRRFDKLQIMRANSVPKRRGDLAKGVSLIQNMIQTKLDNPFKKEGGATIESGGQQASQGDNRVARSNSVSRFSKSTNQTNALPPIRKESVGRFTNR